MESLWGNVALISLVLVICGLMLAVLHRVPPRLRYILIVATTFIGGLFYILEFNLPKGKVNFLSPFLNPVSDAIVVMAAFAILLGVINLSRFHGKAIVKRSEGWGNSVAFFAAMIGMTVFAFWNNYWAGEASEGRETLAAAVYQTFFFGLVVPLNATMFSLLAFFITSAAYRAFRVRSAEAVLMMGAAFIVMLGQVPFGMWLTDWLPRTGPLGALRIETIAGWLMATINSAAYRGMFFGVAVGMLAMSLRIWLSLERGAFFEQR